MGRVRTRRYGVRLAFISAIIALMSIVVGCGTPADTGPVLVRGYLAVALGSAGAAESSGGIFATGFDDKDIYLPGVEVRLEDSQNNQAGEPAVTDLSGRFTLVTPPKARRGLNVLNWRFSLSSPADVSYRICWKSSVYGDGCTSDFIEDGSTPQFVSTVYISVPRRNGFVAVVGSVKTAEGALARTFEPLLNINSFAMVGLDDGNGNRIADVYVNNFGDYLLPYVPVKQRVKLNASIESENFSQEIWPEAQIESAQLHEVNFKFDNNRPSIDPLSGFDAVNNRRVQNAAPGSIVNIKANARDRDGDPVSFAWFVDPGEGKLSQSSGSNVKWTLPNAAGRYTVTVVVYDGRGGYDKAVLSVLADGKGVPFTGVVVEQNGTPVQAAEIEIVGNPVIQTDSNGRFQTRVTEADRYVFNVRKAGFALNSQIYDRGVTGGRWLLRPAQIVTINPTERVRINHDRTERECPGPDSLRAGLGAAGDSLTIPQWQDGKGNIIDPPSWWNGPRSIADLGNRLGNREEQRDLKTDRASRRVIMPRDLKLPECGPGVTVVIPANSILDANGNVAVAPLDVTISTVDLLSPQQMPGDDSVVPMGGGGGNIESFGAGSLDLPTGFKLRPGSSAKVTIPVDRSRLMGGSLPPKVPLLSYDEIKGLWIEEGTLTLVNVAGVSSYEGDTKHFSPFNADNVKTDEAACVRVFSPSLPGQYDLEVSAPLGGTGAPKVLTKEITNTSPFEHVIYNLPNNVNITLAPMTQGGSPQLLGFYIVNSGQPQDPNNAPDIPPGPPYESCQNFVVLTVGSAPESPFGGEFLHGLGYIGATNLGFDDLTTADPTGNALRDAIVTASRNYYTSVDPNNLRADLDAFKSHNGFDLDPNVPVAGELVAQYANSGDLGFGRDMHCLKNADDDVACYVVNYGNGYANVPPGGGTDDHDDADAAGQRATVGSSAEVATVAMEYSSIEGDASGDKVVKFYVYKKDFPNGGDYDRSISANLDGRGERPVPQLCMICHGGLIPSQAGGIPAFNNADQVKLNSRFLPFDYSLFTFPGDPANLTKGDQDASIKALNEQIVTSAPPTAVVDDPIGEVVSGLYNSGASPSQVVFTVPGWVNGASANAAGQADFYEGVIGPSCRTCHIAQPFEQLQFNTSEKFLDLASSAVPANNRLMLGTAQLRVCGDYVMPHALRTHDIFWDVYWDVPEWGAPPAPFRNQFQDFGDGVGGNTWKAALCTSFISNLVSDPSNFYEQSIQPIWNGKCVACHVVGGAAAFLPLTQDNSYAGLVDAGRVVPGDDSDGGSTLMQRITGVGPGGVMPQGCVAPPAIPGPGQLTCLPQTDIDKIKAWIRSGAN